MSSKVLIWNAAYATLVAAQGSGNPLAAVTAGNIYQGVRTSIPQDSYPIIIMEPDDDDETPFVQPVGIESVFRFFVSCQILYADWEKALSGDSDSGAIGLLTFVDAVKNVLQAGVYPGLNPLGLSFVRKLWFPKTTFFFEAFPIREAKITVAVTNLITAQGH